MPHPMCQLEMENGFLNKERRQNTTLSFQKLKDKREREQNDGPCTMDKGLFCQFCDPN